MMMVKNRIEAYTSGKGSSYQPVTDSLPATRSSASELAERALEKHPVAALGAALSLGVLLGWLIKRH